MSINPTDTRIERIKDYARQHMPRLPYHNFDHALDVYRVVTRRSQHLTEDQRHCLQIAALLHDVVYEVGAQDNESRSAIVARQLMEKLDFPESQIRAVEDLILATRMPQRPRTPLEEILCDADLDNLGREDFFEQSRRLREETLAAGRQPTSLDADFLENHTYFTEQAGQERGARKADNLAQTKKLMSDPEDRGENG